MKTIFILASVMFVLFLAAPHRVEAQKRKPAKEIIRSKMMAQPGFYIEIDRTPPCGIGHPQAAMMAFRGRGYSAFYGSPQFESQRNYKSLEKLPGVNVLSAGLFIGPFQTEVASQRVVLEIPSILRKQIAEDRSPESSTGCFEVGVVRVLSAQGRPGSITSLLPEDFVIRPGIGVGRVLIGNSRSEVQAVLGKPRDAGGDYDTWGSGDQGLHVYYRSRAVHHIVVTSPKFHTATGLTMAASRQQFLRAFPKCAKQCCHSEGAGRIFDNTYWDAVTEGIALPGGGGSLIVHPVNEAVNTFVAFGFDGDERCKPCR